MARAGDFLAAGSAGDPGARVRLADAKEVAGLMDAAAYQAFFWSLIHGPAGALDSFREAMADLRQAHSRDLGGALLVMSDVFARAGDFEASQEVLAEALPLVTQVGDAWDIATRRRAERKRLKSNFEPESRRYGPAGIIG